MLGEKQNISLDKKSLDKQTHETKSNEVNRRQRQKESFMFLIRTVNATVIKIIIVFNDSVRFFVNFVNVRLMI